MRGCVEGDRNACSLRGDGREHARDYGLGSSSSADGRAESGLEYLFRGRVHLRASPESDDQLSVPWTGGADGPTHHDGRGNANGPPGIRRGEAVGGEDVAMQRQPPIHRLRVVSVTNRAAGFTRNPATIFL